jgi:hypothetical protein
MAMKMAQPEKENLRYVRSKCARDLDVSRGKLRTGFFQHHTPNKLTVQQLLSVAFERALQRRLGDVPSPTDVHKAVDKLTHSDARPSVFVQHAVRVQEQLARLHTQLQKAQEPQDHAISSIQDPPTMPLTRAQKRSVTYNNDSTHPVQEMKRTRLDSTDPSRPRPHTPPSTSNNKVDSERNAPVRSMILRSQVRHAEPPRADSVRSRQASVTDSPSGLPVMAAEPPTLGPSNNTTSEPNRKTRQRSPSNDNAEGGRVTHSGGPTPVDPGGKAPSASTAIPDDAQGSPLPTCVSDLCISFLLRGS